MEKNQCSEFRQNLLWRQKMDSVKIMDASVSHENDYHGCHERNQKRGFIDKIDSSRFFCGPQIKVK